MKRNSNILNFLSYKNFISFSSLFIIFYPNPIISRQLLNKSEILRQSNECLKDFQYKVCNELFLEMEKMQLFQSEQNRYKCQGSILGLQTELIEAYYFKKFRKEKKGIMIPFVIKNC